MLAVRRVHDIEHLTWKGALAVTGVVAAVLFAAEVVAVKASGLALAALLYAVGTVLLVRKRVGAIVLTLLNLPVLALFAMQLVQNGLAPEAYQARMDFVAVVALVPATAVGVLAAIETLAGRHDGERSRVPAIVAACIVVWTIAVAVVAFV